MKGLSVSTTHVLRQILTTFSKLENLSSVGFEPGPFARDSNALPLSYGRSIKCYTYKQSFIFSSNFVWEKALFAQKMFFCVNNVCRIEANENLTQKNNGYIRILYVF